MRSRYATMTPSAAARLTSGSSRRRSVDDRLGTGRRRCESIVARSVMAAARVRPRRRPVPPPSRVRRARSCRDRPSGASKNDTNPCSAGESSRCGISGAVHVRPPSRGRRDANAVGAARRPASRASAPRACRRRATNTDGKSAQFARRLAPSAIVIGSDQRAPWSEARRTDRPPAARGSSQLSHTRPDRSAKRLGCADPMGAGDASSVSGAAGGVSEDWPV